MLLNNLMNFASNLHANHHKSGSRNNHNDSDDRSMPMSPSNYRQPPTPDHPPPNAQIAEKTILERIRPLSQVGESL